MQLLRRTAWGGWTRPLGTEQRRPFAAKVQRQITGLPVQRKHWCSQQTRQIDLCSENPDRPVLVRACGGQTDAGGWPTPATAPRSHCSFLVFDFAFAGVAAFSVSCSRCSFRANFASRIARN
jgi:hypothetical protein